MNCQHTHSLAGKQEACQLHKLLPGLPVDADNHCLFHSQNIQWKRSTDAAGWQQKLFEAINKTSGDSYGLYGIHFIGAENTDALVEADHLLYVRKFVFKKSISICDAVFWDEVELESCLFTGEFSLMGCTFKKEAVANACRFRENLSFFDECRFTKKLAFYNYNQFSTTFSIANCYFEHDLDLDGCRFEGELYIDQNNLSEEHGLYLFNNEHVRRSSIRNNTHVGLIAVEENRFKESVLFFNFDSNSSFHFRGNKFEKEVIFQGTDTQYLFNPNSILEIEEEDFSGSKARLLFDYCDLLNLEQSTLGKLAEWEENEQVIINDNNNITRFKYVHEIKTRSLPEELLADLFKLVERYFKHQLGIQLNVQIKRFLSEEKIQLSISSRQLIEADLFHKKYLKILRRIFEESQNEEEPTDDLALQTRQLMARIQALSERKLLNKKQFGQSLSLRNEDDLVIVNYIEHMGDKYNIKKSKVGAIGPQAKGTQIDQSTMTNSFGNNLKMGSNGMIQLNNEGSKFSIDSRIPQNNHLVQGIIKNRIGRINPEISSMEKDLSHIKSLTPSEKAEFDFLKTRITHLETEKVSLQNIVNILKAGTFDKEPSISIKTDSCQPLKSNLKLLLRDSEFDQLWEKIEESLLHSSPVYNEFVNHFSLYGRIKTAHRTRRITFEDYNVQLSNLIFTLVATIDSIEPKDLATHSKS
ncbi:MAG: hypothetical protein GYB31_07155 [Bacteroidetes bacterium]|nr:hypothetical protein [Bacteroidota bacterium]